MDIKDIPENFEALQEWSQVSPSIAVDYDEDRVCIMMLICLS